MTLHFHVSEPGLRAGWTFEPFQTLGLIAMVVLYTIGVFRVHRSIGSVGWLRVATFGLGVGLLAVALNSPLHEASENLLAAHMAQHTLLLFAPLALIAGGAGVRILQALPIRLRGAIARRLYGLRWLVSHRISLPVLLATVIIWHLPPVFEPASRIEVLHAIEHLSLLVAAGLYWAAILGIGPRREHRYGVSLASIFILMLVGGVIGGLMTFSTVPWYPEYVERAAAIGVPWLVDQQLAGVLMWLPMGIALMAIGGWLAYRWQQTSLTLTQAPHDRSKTRL